MRRYVFLATTMSAVLAAAQSDNPMRPKSFPTRDAHSAGYVALTTLPDGAAPPADREGNFLLGPTHPAVDRSVESAVRHGRVLEFTMTSAESKLYPGIAREAHTFGTADPANPAKMLVPTSHAAPWTRTVTVYVPESLVKGSAAPSIVSQDGPDRLLIATVDEEVAAGRLPAMVVVSIQNGGGDAQGSERGLEYDTVSGRYAEFVEGEVLPRVEREAGVSLRRDGDSRATIGNSSGGVCAFTMAWFHPEWYGRVIAYSGTFVNQQWPWDAKLSGGAWEYPKMIATAKRKPLRVWLEVGDRDLLNPNALHDGMHDWVEANERMARMLAEKHYAYQFVFAQNAGHVERGVRQQTMKEALEFVWRGYGTSTREAPLTRR